MISKKDTDIYSVRNPGSGLGQAQKCDGVKSVNETPTPSDNRICNNNTYKNKQWQTYTYSFPLK